MRYKRIYTEDCKNKWNMLIDCISNTEIDYDIEILCENLDKYCTESNRKEHFVKYLTDSMTILETAKQNDCTIHIVDSPVNMMDAEGKLVFDSNDPVDVFLPIPQKKIDVLCFPKNSNVYFYHMLTCPDCDSDFVRMEII